MGTVESRSARLTDGAHRPGAARTRLARTTVDGARKLEAAGTAIAMDVVAYRAATSRDCRRQRCADGISEYAGSAHD
jgi:hypothetical protein